jgi:hypothetical protein
VSRTEIVEAELAMWRASDALVKAKGKGDYEKATKVLAAARKRFRELREAEGVEPEAGDAVAKPATHKVAAKVQRTAK